MKKKKEWTLAEIQKRGGEAVKKKYGKEYFRELGRKAGIASGKARRKKKGL